MEYLLRYRVGQAFQIEVTLTYSPPTNTHPAFLKIKKSTKFACAAGDIQPKGLFSLRSVPSNTLRLTTLWGSKIKKIIFGKEFSSQYRNRVHKLCHVCPE